MCVLSYLLIQDNVFTTTTFRVVNNICNNNDRREKREYNKRGCYEKVYKQTSICLRHNRLSCAKLFRVKSQK